MADLSVGLLTFENGSVAPANQPKLSCSATNQLTLDVSSLRLDTGRELFFRDNGQVRCFDDHHRLVFNRQALSLELHEQGDICFLTGGPPPEERLRISANGNVGIGTTAPVAKLQVTGGAIMPAVGNTAQAGIQFPTNPGGGLGDEAFIRYFANVGETTKLLIGIGNDADDTIGFQQAGAERLSISNGNVGIGTTTPQQKLDVSGNAAINNVFLGEVGHGPEWAGVAHKNSVGTTQYGLLQHRDGIYTLINKKSGGGYLGFRVDNIDKMVILDNGRIGIGTTSPAGTLDVNGDIRAGGSALYFTQTNHNHTGIGNTAGFAAIENAANFGALMILGRSMPGGRIVQLWDHVQVRNGNITVQGKIGTNGLPATPKKNGWGGGIRTWDVEAEGTIWSAHGLDTSPHDLAENYYSDQTLEPGDVVCLDRARDRIVMSTEPNDCLTLGIISTQPGLLLNADHEEERVGMIPVALSGRVPCKVTDENGPIQRGDLLTTSSTPGHAMKAKSVLVNGVEIYRPGTIIGKALEPHEWKSGVIETFVCLR